MLVDLSNGELFHLPLLRNSLTPLCSENTGIHSMQASFDSQYLAAGGYNPHELAIYKLPELTPYALGQVSMYCTLHFANLIFLTLNVCMYVFAVLCTIPCNFRVATKFL